MRRSIGSIGLLLVAAPLAATTCDRADSVVVVKVDADPDVTAVLQIRAWISNGGDGATRFVPTAATTSPIAFETSFSLSVPRDRSGALDIALDALGAGAALVGNGAGTVDLHGADQATVTITLHAGPSSCGNGAIDSGEACDDGDRLSTGDCDYVCQSRTGGPGTGGGGGTSGSAGTGGTGQAGTSGAAGSAGTGGSATAGAGGTTAGAGATGTGGTAGRPCVVELLTSGDFEGSNAAWTQVTDARPRALIYDKGLAPSFVPTPQSPTHLAWLGYDVLSMSAALRQQIQVPADAVQLNISGYFQIQTDESPCLCDFGYVELERPGTAGGTTTVQLEKWSNEDASSDWAPFATFLNAAGIAGQTVTLQLRAEMDDGVNSSFYFDSISVTANRCP